ASGAAGQIRMDHVALDGSRANDRDFHDDIIKTFWFEAGQGGHLGATFDLKDANGIGLLHHFEGGLVILWNFCEVHRMAALASQCERILHDGHHAKAEQVYFDDAEVIAIVLVPLSDDAARHGSIFQRHHRIELALTDD